MKMKHIAPDLPLNLCISFGIVCFIFLGSERLPFESLSAYIFYPYFKLFSFFTPIGTVVGTGACYCFS
ncbi:hypothetical protein FKM82_018238 [Ascaphus truei]